MIFFTEKTRNHTPLFFLISIKITFIFFPITILKISARCFSNENTRIHGPLFSVEHTQNHSLFTMNTKKNPLFFLRIHSKSQLVVVPLKILKNTPVVFQLKPLKYKPWCFCSVQSLENTPRCFYFIGTLRITARCFVDFTQIYSPFFSVINTQNHSTLFFQ